MRLALAVLCALAGVARADGVVDCEPDEVDAIAARLDGHRFEVAADRRSIRLLDVAGEGEPEVGVVVREGEHLVLVTRGRRLRLAGPLARPRIAGPGYTVWVHGTHRAGSVPTLTARRLGILKRPRL